METPKKLELGMEVRDRVTGFQGIITSRTTYLNACDRLAISPRVDKEGKLPETEVFDEPDLIFVSNGIYVPPAPKPKRNGGPHPIAERVPLPSRDRR